MRFSRHHPSLESSFFFFNDTATTEIYTLSLHDALPIWQARGKLARHRALARPGQHGLLPGAKRGVRPHLDRKSTRLNSSHLVISYAVFCLKKKKNTSLSLSTRASRHI